VADGSDGAALVILVLSCAAIWGIARAVRRPKPRGRRRAHVPMRMETPRASGRMTTQEFEAGRTLLTEGGERVRSQAEVRIANALRRRGMRYVYEPRICGFRPDFFLPDHRIIIEYWGLDEPAYNQRRRTKTAAYLREGYKLVSLGPNKGISVERDLDRQLYYKLQAP
jgi:very-short-patch-repair endonuclease